MMSGHYSMMTLMTVVVVILGILFALSWWIFSLFLCSDSAALHAALPGG